MTESAAIENWQAEAAKVDAFVTRFGHDGYRELAYYAALPLVLTPELVHYLRTQFLREANVPWEAEVDLLLSDLCSQVGYELYTLDTQVRAYLLAQMKTDPHWQQRQVEVAQVLITYVSYLSRINPHRRQRELDAQRLAAMTYLGDESCQAVAQEIAERLKQLEVAEAQGESTHSIRAELAYLTRLTQELSPQLEATPELVEWAALVQRLLRQPEAVTEEEVARSYRVGDYTFTPSALPIELPSETGETLVDGLPPIKTLTFETGRWVEASDEEAATDWPPLETQTVRVAELYFTDAVETEAEPNSPTPATPTGPALTPFSFEVAKIRREGETAQWVIDWEPGSGRLYEEPLGDDLTLEMVVIPSGSFVMGSPEDELERQNDEGPRHRVQVPGFYMGRYPVTQRQWKFVAALPRVQLDLAPDPSKFKGAYRPVETVQWFDTVEFCARLSAYTGQKYRLPSEAEWEYACRANTTTPFYFGKALLPELANYRCSGTYNGGPSGEFTNETSRVGQFGVTNTFGLSDMHGNVWEWCLDHYHDSYEGAPTNGTSWIDEDADVNQFRLFRGGSWFNEPTCCRSAYRDYLQPRVSSSDLGLRVVCVAARALE